ncbi:MAG: helix-turn-helix domain-containing protein [Planctomycetes bacterium]|jgi:predicted DNA-binding transcriptional regulator AlpA|nr:helix-turn-helix domain-containing protein [Planctomycetota bacterium]
MAEKPSSAQINAGTSLPHDETLLLDDEGAARFLQISASMFRKLVRVGKAPLPLKLGACARWRVDELRAWVRADCPDRERWMEMRDAALAEAVHCVASDDKMKKSIRAAA